MAGYEKGKAIDRAVHSAYHRIKFNTGSISIYDYSFRLWADTVIWLRFNIPRLVINKSLKTVDYRMLTHDAMFDTFIWPLCTCLPPFYEGRTGVFSRWLADSWPKVCVTREEPECDMRDFTTLFQVILRRKSSEWLEWFIESNLGMWFAIELWSFDLAIRDFAFIWHCFRCKNRSLKRVSYQLIFMIFFIRDPWSSIFPFVNRARDPMYDRPSCRAASSKRLSQELMKMFRTTANFTFVCFKS